MFVTIAGGGKVGYYLTKTLIPLKHKVVIIERQKELCTKVANDLGIPVYHGDATDTEILSDIGISDADVFVAVTGQDENNLISCQLAKRNFGVKKTIARVNNPKNIDVFKRLGVDIAVSSTSIIAELIEQEIDYYGLRTLLELKNGKVVISEIVIEDGSPASGKMLKDINLPKGCIIISIIRNDDAIIPHGSTQLEAEDFIILVSSADNQHQLRKYFTVS
jgi:trk system potassium uptake protein TrkA